VSRKATKRTKVATALPLVSPHWWPCEKTVAYCCEHKGDRRGAALALLAAFNQGEPGPWVKAEWFDQQTSPPVPHTKLLSAEDYELKAVDFYKVWLVQPRRPDVPVLDRPALFFWGPKVKELWPMEETAPAQEEIASETEAQQRQKRGQKAFGNWPDLLTRELVRVAFEEPDLMRDQLAGGDKLVKHLRKVLMAEIKGWNLSQNKAIHQKLKHLLSRIT
jgi:hypothetical protein